MDRATFALTLWIAVLALGLALAVLVTRSADTLLLALGYAGGLTVGVLLSRALPS
jgi:hypothetical protein